MVVSKSFTGDSTLYAVDLDALEDSPATLQEVLTLNFGSEALPGSTMLTAGDISASGRWLLLKTYTHAWIWPRLGEEPVEQWLARPACSVPLQLELQGEAIAFSADEMAYQTVSEGSHVPLLRYALLDAGDD